jgi:hypothetical protein
VLPSTYMYAGWSVTIPREGQFTNSIGDHGLEILFLGVPGNFSRIFRI